MIYINDISYDLYYWLIMSLIYVRNLESFTKPKM